MTQCAPLSWLATFGCFEQRGEDLAATTHRRQPHAVRRPAERISGEGDFHRRIARVLSGNLGHLLVHGDRVLVRGPEFAAGQPHRNAVVVMAQGTGMIQPADRRDHFPMLFQRLQRTRELVIPPRCGDLVVQRMHTVGEIDERSAFRRLCLRFSPPQRHHAFQERQRDARAQGPQCAAPIDQPGL